MELSKVNTSDLLSELTRRSEVEVVSSGPYAQFELKPKYTSDRTPVVAETVLVIRDTVIEVVEKRKAERDALRELTAPIVEWIREHHNPHTEVHISWDHVWVRQDLLGLPFLYSEE